MKLEDKFIYLLSIHSKESYKFFMNSVNGFIHICCRVSWDDGLSNRSRVRIINPALGISSAPNGWDHFLRLLALNEITPEMLEKSIDREIRLSILESNQSLTDMKTVFGEEYVSDVINKGALGAFAGFASLFKSLLKRKESSPSLEVIKGGKE